MQPAPQALKPAWQLNAQLAPSHVAAPLSGAGQGAHRVPHDITLASVRHCPPQSCVPDGHCPMQTWSAGMHAFAQSRWPVGHAAPHVVPSHVAVPPVGAGQGSQDAPQCSMAAPSTHTPPHAWKRVVHASWHARAGEQVAIPFGGVPQSCEVQQPPSGAQVPSGHDLYPAPQLAPHAWPSHVAVPLAGVGQPVQALGPQLLRLVSDAQRPLQPCVPVGQTALQGLASGTHAPAQSFWSLGQAPPQVVPSHVAMPPTGGAHAVQELPQVCTDVSTTQAAPQRWWPAAQSNPHVTPSQVVRAPSGGSGQGGPQLVPHVAGSVSSTHAPAQACVPGPHPRSSGGPSSAGAPPSASAPSDAPSVKPFAPSDELPASVGAPRCSATDVHSGVRRAVSPSANSAPRASATARTMRSAFAT
jgi:hypothetical protein